MEGISGRLSLRFGPEVADWAARVPDRVADLAREWGLVPGGSLPQGASSVVVPAVRAGVPVVLKLSPDEPFLAEQTAVLRLFGPSGKVPAVLAEAPGALLMTAVLPGTEVADLPVAPAPGEWADLVGPLHALRPRPGLRDLRDRCEEFFTRIGRRVTPGTPVTPGMWEEARTRCHALLDDQPRVLLHGDLHPGNVLTGPAGLVAIDPRPCVGDPCFDVVDFALDAAGREGVARRAPRLAAACGLDPERLAEWCRVLAPVNAMSYPDDEPVLTELLALAR
ncbi:aminoglycoside phosphotransferase [Saccharothrix syringae]|uniref:Aminoglycoside phosphotransferase n=1 Tax=Saccharothrix syringae TaxID=103733 RepID=A0A5Q0HFP9_SACSY|nr:aminoglycoside phosphotransferase [Saccharothrix syringae]